MPRARARIPEPPEQKPAAVFTCHFFQQVPPQGNRDQEDHTYYQFHEYEVAPWEVNHHSQRGYSPEEQAFHKKGRLSSAGDKKHEKGNQSCAKPPCRSCHSREKKIRGKEEQKYEQLRPEPDHRDTPGVPRDLALS